MVGYIFSKKNIVDILTTFAYYIIFLVFQKIVYDKILICGMLENMEVVENLELSIVES